jgi:ABC-type dipeptide/oligopeptide/nickel transport system permease subunit
MATLQHTAVRPPVHRRGKTALGNFMATSSRLLRHRFALIGLLLIGLEVGLAAFAPLVAPYDPSRIDALAMLSGPTAMHPLGTDDLGRDILSRLIYGAQISLSISVASVALAVLIGVPLGLLSGYIGGALDETVMRVLDSVMSLPPLVLALTIAAVLGAGIFNGMLAISIVSVPVFTRLVRGQVLSVKHNDYVLAAQSVGVPPWLIIFRHILPNSINPVIVQASLAVGFAIITESSLSFIGLGAQPPTPTWGSMVQVGFQYLETAPEFVLAPATMIFLAVLGFNMLGEGLRDVLDPHARVRI